MKVYHSREEIGAGLGWAIRWMSGLMSDFTQPENDMGE